MRTLNTVDLFCGAGGASTGLQQACEQLGMRNSELAINHWKVAVQTFTANHPGAEVLETDLERVVPEEVAKSRVIDLLWASPSCTHHSRAKGGKPRANQLRAQPELVLSWLDQLFVRRVIIENVPEIIEWGPLNKAGAPIAAKKGDCFHAWVAAIEAKNYRVEWRILNCADYGDATTRKRFFLQAVRAGCGKIAWPEQTRSETESNLFGLPKWKGVDSCLDLADVGTSAIFRKKPLSANTMRRIMAGLKKFYGARFQIDFLGMDRPGDVSRVRAINDPMPTQHAGGNRVGVVTPFVVRLNNHCDVCDVKNPLPAVATSGGHYMLATPFVMDFFKNGEARQATDPMGAQTTHDRFSLVSPMVLDMSHPGDNDDAARVRPATEPMRTATARNNAAVATPLLDGGRIVDVFIRMFKPREVARVHSFPENYELCGNRSEQMKQLGNSVPVATAKAMCLAALSA